MLRKYLVRHLDFTGKLLTSTMNELNKTSNAYKGCRGSIPLVGAYIKESEIL